MATLLGEATLTSQFISTFDDVRVVTDDSNRVTTTSYRNPIAIHTQDLGTIETRDFRPIFDEEFDTYLESNYYDENYAQDTFIWSTGVTSPVDALQCAYDFLDVDPKATITSIQVQATIQSTGAANGNGNYGKLKARWRTEGGGYHDSSTQTVSSQTRQTITFTITPDSAWTSNHPTGLGGEHWLSLQAEDTFTAMTVYAVKARVNYTGRTRFVTGFKQYSSITHTEDQSIPSENTHDYETEGYGFAIPSNHSVDGILMRYGFGTVENGTYPLNSLHFQTNTGGRISTSSLNTLYDFTGAGYLSGGEADVYARFVNAIDEHNTQAQLTTAEVNDSTFGVDAGFAFEFVSTDPGNPIRFDLNFAHVGPFISGDIGISTTSTVTATPVMTHVFNDDEIDDFTGTVTLTALGGFKLVGAPQTQASAFTTTVGTAGRIRPGESNINTAFTVTVSAINDLSGAAVTFPTATVSVSAAVERTTPANINTTVTVSTGLAGMTRTNHTITAPAVATFSAVSGISLLKAVDPDRIFVSPTQTRTHIIPEQLRTETIEQQTRTHVIDAQVRTITVDTQTRTAPVEGM